MTTTPKTQAIRRARHEVRMIQARRREGMPTQPEPSPARMRALGICIGESVRSTTLGAGRGMPDRNSGSVFEVAAWCGALAGGLLLVAALVF
jgi:hypothetical protein